MSLHSKKPAWDIQAFLQAWKTLKKRDRRRLLADPFLMSLFQSQRPRQPRGFQRGAKGVGICCSLYAHKWRKCVLSGLPRYAETVWIYICLIQFRYRLERIQWYNGQMVWIEGYRSNMNQWRDRAFRLTYISVYSYLVIRLLSTKLPANLPTYPSTYTYV